MLLNEQVDSNINYGFDSMLLSPIFEETWKELLNKMDAPRRGRSDYIKVWYKGVAKTKGWITFNTSSQYTPGKKYYQYIKLLDMKDIDAVKDMTKKEIIRLMLQGNIAVYCSCLKEDTKIKLLDGRTLTVQEMEKEFNNGKELWVYSTDLYGDFRPGKVEKVWVTGTTKEYIKVVLDNNKEIFTTRDHLYMLGDGSYLRADKLTVGQSLMPVRFDYINGYTANFKIKSIETITLEKEEVVYDIKVDKWKNFCVDAGVVLHNCPDFLYKGFKYMGYMHGWGIFRETRFPKIRNPHLEGSICKHLGAVLRVYMLNWLKIYRDMIKSYYFKSRYKDD